MSKYIKVMAEYTCQTAFWHKNGVPYDVDEVASLGLNPFILKRIEKWIDWYETNDDWSDESESVFDYEGFSAEGKSIAQQVKKLLPDYEIVYFNEHLAALHTVDKNVIYMERIEL